MIRLTFCILCVSNFVSVKSIVVRTTLGPVRGKAVHDKVTGVSYCSFEGIPYAEPPVGDLRFKPPVRKQSWRTVFDATKPGCVCPQTELYHSRKEMSEDCLTFNIFTPALHRKKSLPVMFVIHSGHFDSQSGNTAPIYGPQLIIQSDVVVVTINYRLGALGFLSFCSEDISGNAGLKDVILALKIIHENIILFGGDPNNITIYGSGAGAAMAGLLMLTKQCEGLFRRVVLISGCVLNSNYIQINPRENALSLARELDLDLSNRDCLIEKLKHVDAFDIVEAQEAISRRDPQRGFRIYKPFKPTVEIECDSAVLTRAPLHLLNEGSIYDVPIMIGFNDQEGLEVFPTLENEPELIDKLNEHFELLIPEDIKYAKRSAKRRNLAACIRDFYFGGGNITFVKVQNYINLISDSQYSFGIDLFVKLFKEKKTSPVYYYVFAGDTELNWFKAFHNITYPGAAHHDNIGYFFMTSVTESKFKDLDPTSKRLQNALLQNGKHFLYYGTPPRDAANSWPEAGLDHQHIIINNHEIVPVCHSPLPERIGFWSSVYEKYFTSAPHAGPYFCTNDDVRSLQ